MSINLDVADLKLNKFCLGGEKTVSGTGRIPLWVVATIVGLGVIAVVGTFFYGSYTHLGSSL